jgi:hypothetical protein
VVPAAAAPAMFHLYEFIKFKKNPPNGGFFYFLLRRMWKKSRSNVADVSANSGI